MSEQEEIRRIALEIGYYEEQAQDVQKQIMQLQARAQENTAAIAALQNMQSAQETLFPIGGGVLLKAKIGAADKVLVDVGAGVIAEKSTQDAIQTLKQKNENYEKAAAQMQEALRELGGRVQQLQEAAALTKSSTKQQQTVSPKPKKK